MGGVPGLALLHLFVVYMAYSHYAPHHHYYYPSSPNTSPNLPLLRDTISGEMKGTQRADQGGPVQGQFERGWSQVKKNGNGPRAARHHTLVVGFMLSERNRKRERKHYNHILER